MEEGRGAVRLVGYHESSLSLPRFSILDGSYTGSQNVAAGPRPIADESELLRPEGVEWVIAANEIECLRLLSYTQPLKI